MDGKVFSPKITSSQSTVLCYPMDFDFNDCVIKLSYLGDSFHHLTTTLQVQFSIQICITKAGVQ